MALQFEKLGPYRIGRQLGRGGMGTVFAAVHTGSELPAAIKVLSAALAQEEGFRARFESEIETLRKLRHPNIVRLFGFGEHEGHLFYAMELVDGTSLEDELRDGRKFDWREVNRITVHLARALKHAHDRGVVHRDIKPANIMMTRDGKLKLSDFGIAKLFGSTGLTSDGGVIGTAEYMAPEQADGQPVTYRADLYSLGGVMYALLAGRPPFRARSLVEMLQMQRFAEPEPVRRYADDVPEELEQIVQELLAKEPSQRIPNAMILAKRLEAMEQGLDRRQHQTIAGEDSAGFNLTPQGAIPKAKPGKPEDAETVAATMDSPAEGPSSGASVEGATFALAGEGEGGTVGPNPAVPVVDFSLAPSVASKSQTALGTATGATRVGASRFVTVADEDQTNLDDESEPGLISAQTWALVAALSVVGLGAWYLLQPVSADRLYERIMVEVEGGEIEALLSVEGDIQDFLNHHPADRRGSELRDFLEEIELHRAQRRFERQARGIGRGGAMLPVERMYLEAVRYVQLDPAVGAAKLKALIDVFGGEAYANAQTERCLELARHQLIQLQTELEGAATEQLGILRQRIARADELRATDLAGAASIYRGIIELYGDKPWAEEVVAVAHERLSEESQAPDATTADAGSAEEEG